MDSIKIEDLENESLEELLALLEGMNDAIDEIEEELDHE